LSGSVTIVLDTISAAPSRRRPNAQNRIPIARVPFFVNGGTPIGAATSEPFTVQSDTNGNDSGRGRPEPASGGALGKIGRSSTNAGPLAIPCASSEPHSASAR
jgi:hypothetical protein